MVLSNHQLPSTPVSLSAAAASLSAASVSVSTASACESRATHSVITPTITSPLPLPVNLLDRIRFHIHCELLAHPEVYYPLHSSNDPNTILVHGDFNSIKNTKGMQRLLATVGRHIKAEDILAKLVQERIEAAASAEGVAAVKVVKDEEAELGSLGNDVRGQEDQVDRAIEALRACDQLDVVAGEGAGYKEWKEETRKAEMAKAELTKEELVKEDSSKVKHLEVELSEGELSNAELPEEKADKAKEMGQLGPCSSLLWQSVSGSGLA
ncbi:hypothetical protein E4T39_00600 [Aureobasidium subglaciale]|nr:hypothetical protein E4T39_00600 [Aureobasidium subglaciale]